MKIRLLIFLLSCVSFVTADVSNVHSHEESFLKAHAYYRAKNYEKALEQYMTITKPSAGVLYDIGNSYYKIKKYPQALAYWLRAQRAASLNLLHKINNNIDRLMHNQQKEYYYNSFGRVGMYALACVPLLFLQLLILIMLLILIVLVFRRTYYIKTMLVLLIVGICSSGLVTYSYMMHTRSYGIVNSSSVPVYAGPSQRYAQVGTLSELDQVTIGKREDTWYKICHCKLTGWVSSQALEIV